MNTPVKTANRLSKEKSPYLLQHAHNPVDWYPWGEEAFAKARTEAKPIFLSIGYSTCHWCHVMERESFEKEEIGKILNEHFIAIKVDREERPDIDAIYMSVCQAMTGHGGWPLTIIMTPDKKPFFAGTYFPNKSVRGMPGLVDILTQIAAMWQERRNELRKSAEEITKVVSTHLFSHAGGKVSAAVLDKAFAYFEDNFDPRYGGFGPAPSSPPLTTYLFSSDTGKHPATVPPFKWWKKPSMPCTAEASGITSASASLAIPQIEKWFVPHFEKMLYDNALLAIAYLETYQATGNRKYAETAAEIFTYVLRDMTDPQGGFYSAEDADSEGEEGKFYLWTPAEVNQVLGDNLGSQFCRDFDITAGGNFEGQCIPNLIKTGYVEGYEEARKKLFSRRNERVRPFKDDKILTAWNGLMIAALAYGARVLGKTKYAKAAEKAVSFINANLRRDDGRLLARHRDQEAAYLAYLDDYAFLVWGLIELYQATLKHYYLRHALDLTRDMLKYFWDDTDGGFYLYGNDAEKLIARPKEIYDGATPSGNSVAAVNLTRLARLTGDLELEQKRRQQLNAFGGSVAKSPPGHAHFLMAAWLDQTAPTDIVLVGNPKADDTLKLLSVINNKFTPEAGVTLKPLERKEEDPAQTALVAQNKQNMDGKATAYVCKAYSCQQPINDPQELEKML